MKRRFRLPALSTWDVSVFFWILGIVLGTIAAVCFQISSGSGHAGLESVLAARLGQEIGDPSGAGWHLNAGMKAASRGTLFFQVWLQRSGMALMLWLAGMTPVACLAAWGGLSRLRSGAGMAAGRIYWLGRFLGTACICGNVISTGGVLYSCVLAASFLGACKGEADTDGWIFNPFIGAGDGNSAGSVAESWFCIITGLTLPILMGLSE